jgi:hypothetical protein
MRRFLPFITNQSCAENPKSAYLSNKNLSEGVFMKQKKLTVTFYIGGKQVDKLTSEQCERMAQKLSETLSVYYTAHPDEFKALKQN